jgi:hypothetical protein
MTRDPHKNSAASVRARLLALAQNKGEDYSASPRQVCHREVFVSPGPLTVSRQICDQGSDAVYALDRPDSSANQGLGSTRMGSSAIPRMSLLH